MHSGFWFVLVGASAAVTHMAVFTVVLLLVPTLWPEVANVAGFLVAFLVSFVGHRRWSFQDAGTSVMQSLLRFAATAVAGFVTNEAVFIVLFRVLALPTWVALISGIVVSAVQTFVLSRFWAFKRNA
jgi:putative flippase GtrA